MKATIKAENKIGTAEAEVGNERYSITISTKLQHHKVENEESYISDGEQLVALSRRIRNELQRDLERWKQRDEEISSRIYYDLLRLEYEDEFSCHIPIPVLFRRLGVPKYTKLLTSVSERKERTGDYYTCPICGRSSFYQGICRRCRVRQPSEEIPEEYQEYEEEKAERKEAFFRTIQDLSKYGGLADALEELNIASLSYVYDPSSTFRRY